MYADFLAGPDGRIVNLNGQIATFITFLRLVIKLRWKWIPRADHLNTIAGKVIQYQTEGLANFPSARLSDNSFIAPNFKREARIAFRVPKKKTGQ